MRSLDATLEQVRRKPHRARLPVQRAAREVEELWHPTRAAAGTALPTRGEQARRILNVFAASILLILSAPIMLVVAAAVKLSSPGPVFYVQSRVGLDRREGRERRRSRSRKRGGKASDRRDDDTGGRVFRIYKFRTMRVEENASQVWATEDDPRITGIGKVLRKYRLDELPQLINVLKGDMNLVGPRPEQPAIFSELREQVDQYPKRQKVLPGITGWAQINHSYDQSIEDVRKKVHLDLEYLHERSPLKDLWIMIKTVPVMIFKRGAM